MSGANHPTAETFDRRRFEQAPCYICGYNGAGYYHSGLHRCAALYHGYKLPQEAPLTSNVRSLLEDLRNDDRVSMQHTAWLEERAAKEIERLRAALRDVMNRSHDHNEAIGIANNALFGEPPSSVETAALPVEVPADHRSGTEPLSRVIADLEMAVSPDLSRSIADRFEIVEKVLQQLRAAQKVSGEPLLDGGPDT